MYGSSLNEWFVPIRSLCSCRKSADCVMFFTRRSDLAVPIDNKPLAFKDSSVIDGTVHGNLTVSWWVQSSGRAGSPDSRVCNYSQYPREVHSTINCPGIAGISSIWWIDVFNSNQQEWEDRLLMYHKLKKNRRYFFPSNKLTFPSPITLSEKRLF